MCCRGEGGLAYAAEAVRGSRPGQEEHGLNAQRGAWLLGDAVLGLGEEGLAGGEAREFAADGGSWGSCLGWR